MRKYVVALLTLGCCVCVCLAFDVLLASMLLFRDVASSLEQPEITPTVLRLPPDEETLSTAELLRESAIPERSVRSCREAQPHWTRAPSSE